MFHLVLLISAIGFAGGRPQASAPAFSLTEIHPPESISAAIDFDMSPRIQLLLPSDVHSQPVFGNGFDIGSELERVFSPDMEATLSSRRNLIKLMTDDFLAKNKDIIQELTSDRLPPADQLLLLKQKLSGEKTKK